MSHYRRLGLLSFALCMSCSVVKTSTIDHSAQLSPDSIAYFLPLGLIHMVIDYKNTGKTDITIDEVIVPDTTQQYRARITDNILSKDNTKVVVNNGLLQQVTSTSEDQTAVVAKNLATTAKQIIELAAVAAGGEAGSEQTTFHAEVTFNPFDDADVQSVNTLLAPMGGSIAPLTCPGGSTSTTVTDEAAGVLYRPAFPFQLAINFSGRGTGVEFANAPMGRRAFLVNLPSKCSPILSLDISRTAFGKNVTTVNFSNGTLADVSIEKDSEAAGLSQIPVDVTAELLTLPADLLTLRYNNVSDQDKLVNAQATLLDDQTKLLDALKSAQAAQSPPSPSASPSPTPTARPTVDLNKDAKPLPH